MQTTRKQTAVLYTSSTDIQIFSQQEIKTFKLSFPFFAVSGRHSRDLELKCRKSTTAGSSESCVMACEQSGKLKTSRSRTGGFSSCNIPCIVAWTVTKSGKIKPSSPRLDLLRSIRRYTGSADTCRSSGNAGFQNACIPSSEPTVRRDSVHLGA